MNTLNSVHIKLAAVVQLVALEMNVTTRYVEPQTSQYASVRKIFPWLTYTKVFGVSRTYCETNNTTKKIKYNKKVFQQYKK